MSYLVSEFPKGIEDKLESLWYETPDTWYEFISVIGDENGFVVSYPPNAELEDQYEFESKESYTMFLLRWS